MRRTHITVQLHHCPLPLCVVPSYQLSQLVTGHAICIVVKVCQSAHIRSYSTLWFGMLNTNAGSVLPTADSRNVLDLREGCTLLTSTWRYSSLLDPCASLEVIIIVNVCKAAVRKRINRFALLLPAVRSHLCRALIPREGQVGSDAVPDSIAHHVVTAALCADQLSPVKT